MRKNISFTIILSLIFTFSLQAKKPHVVASASMFEDMAMNIGGDLITVDKIVSVGADPHLYEPIPADAQKVVKADLILINGLTFEGWITELVANSGTKAKSIFITEGINAIRSEQYTNATDPHAWMDANNGKIYAKNIHKALVEIDPDNKEGYDKNLKNYVNKLDELDAYIKAEINKIPSDKRILVTSHDAFAYFGKAYDLTLEAIVGISTEAEAQTSDIIRVSKAISANQIPAVFVESTINPKMLKQIASDNDVVIGGELFADSLGDKGGPAGTYIDMLKQNADAIVAGLTRKVAIDPNQSSSNSWLIYGILGLVFILLLFIVIRRLSV